MYNVKLSIGVYSGRHRKLMQMNIINKRHFKRNTLFFSVKLNSNYS
jgi:hypothetical protein